MFISINYIVFVRTPMIKILDPPLIWRERLEGCASAQADPAALALFRAAAVLSLGNGRSTLF